MVGATMQMVSHGLITGLCLLTAGLVMHNTHERDIAKLGGLARADPDDHSDLTIGRSRRDGRARYQRFIAEFMTFLGSFQNSSTIVHVFTIIAILGILMGAGYILWLLQRVFYGRRRIIQRSA